MTTLVMARSRLGGAWRASLAAVLLFLTMVIMLYWGTGVAMVSIWLRSETFTHAFVVPPIVAWLIWRKRGELTPMQPSPSAWALVSMGGAAMLWWLGDIVNVAAATQAALALMIVTSVPLLLGWRVASTLAFPLGFLFFAVPIGEFMTPTLMHWTAEVLVASLRLTGIPVYQEGQHLVIPSGRWAVVEACSGIRYLMATFMVGSLFAYLNYQGNRKRLTFVAVSLVMPVVANWVRAYIIVMLGHLSDNKIATGVDHLVYGWVFFGVVILALFFIGARWADPDDADALKAAAIRTAATRSDAPVASWRPALLAGLAIALVAGPNLGRLHDEPRHATAAVQLQLPEVMGRWQAVPTPSQPWTPNFQKATESLVRSYRGPGGEVTVHIAYYRGQRPDVKLVSSVNGFVSPDQAWHVVSRGAATSAVDGRTVQWLRAVLSNSDGIADSSRRGLTVWRVYWLGGRLARGDVEAKLIQAWQAVSGEPDDGAAIHLASSVADETGAEQHLASFANENFAMLERALASAKAGR